MSQIEVGESSNPSSTVGTQVQIMAPTLGSDQNASDHGFQYWTGDQFIFGCIICGIQSDGMVPLFFLGCIFEASGYARMVQQTKIQSGLQNKFADFV